MLVVGGTGRVGRRVVARLASLGVRVRVLTRDPNSPAAAELVAACPEGAAVEMVRGDVAEGDLSDDANLCEAVRGCTQVIACFGAQRIAKITDVFTRPEESDSTHPAAVNYRGVARLAAAAAEAGTVRRFVRVTGMSVGCVLFFFFLIFLASHPTTVRISTNVAPV